MYVKGTSLLSEVRFRFNPIKARTSLTFHLPNSNKKTLKITTKNKQKFSFVFCERQTKMFSVLSNLINNYACKYPAQTVNLPAGAHAFALQFNTKEKHAVGVYYSDGNGKKRKCRFDSRDQFKQKKNAHAHTHTDKCRHSTDNI